MRSKHEGTSDLNAHVLLIDSRFLSRCFFIRTTGLLSATQTTTCWTSRPSRRHTSCLHPSWWMLTGILTLLTISAWCQEERTARMISSYLNWDTWLTVRHVPSKFYWWLQNFEIWMSCNFMSLILLFRWWGVGWAGTWPADSREPRKLAGQSHQTAAKWAGWASERSGAAWGGWRYTSLCLFSSPLIAL